MSSILDSICDDECFKGICGGICFFLVAGPVLLIVGIVFLVSPNTRLAHVTAYNKAIADYNISVTNGWYPGSYISGVPMLQQTALIQVLGNTEEVNLEGTQSYGEVALSYSTLPITFDYSVKGVSNFTRTPLKKKSQSTSIYCGASSGKSCTASSQASKCSSTYNGVYSGGSCSGGSSCGPCTYDTFLQVHCSVLAKSVSGQWVQDAAHQSCFYPFGFSNQMYVMAAPDFVFVRVLSSDDPFLVLQAETKGAADFGMTASEQFRLGLGLVIAGSIVTLAVLAGLCGFVHCATGGSLCSDDEVVQTIETAPEDNDNAVEELHPAEGEVVADSCNAPGYPINGPGFIMPPPTGEGSNNAFYPQGPPQPGYVGQQSNIAPGLQPFYPPSQQQVAQVQQGGAPEPGPFPVQAV